VLGKPLVDTYITAEYKEPVRSVLTAAATGGEEVASFEFPLYTKTGERVELLLNATTRRDADGEIMGVLGVGQDITEKVHAEKAQSAIATELLTLIDSANAPIFGVDTDLLITEWNQKAAQITGYSKEEVLGKPLVDTYITAEYRDPVRSVLTAAATGGQQAASYEFPLYTKGGDRRELLLNATTRRDADGEIIGVLGVGLDMTAARAVQRQLDVSEKAKLALWGCIREGVATVEGDNVLDGTIVECNAAMCELCGVTPDQLRGTTLSQILVKSGQDLEQISKSSSDDEHILEFCLRGSDKVIKNCEATFMEIPALDVDEKVTRLALVVRDRTWKKELERQATELMLRAERVRTLNKQLKWVQHQVKNSALALDFRLRQVIDVLSKEEVYAVVDGVEAEFNALQKEVNSLMHSLEKHVMLGEMASGCYLPRFQEHDVPSILGQVFRRLDEVDDSQVFRARLDIYALHHATSNLESNADKYSAPQTKVVKVVRMYKCLPPTPVAQDTIVVQGLQIGDRIPAGPDEGAIILAMLHVSVSNTVVPDDFARLMKMQNQGGVHSLFDEGMRIAGERHAASSAGEGLALTKSVCASLFGTLWVKLDVETRTIYFHITVPALFPAVDASAHMQSGVGVLAIDDCPTQRMMLTVYLKKLGAPFQVLGDKPEHYTDICGIADGFIQRHGGVTLVAILDQNLMEDPVVLGTQLAGQLRDHCRPQDLVTLIRSGNTMTDDIKLYLTEADGFLEKNDSFPVLRSKIIAQLAILAEHQDTGCVDGEEDMSIEDMEAEAVKEMKNGLLEAIEDWLTIEHIEVWETSQKQLHSMKGSIKGIEGMMGDTPLPGQEKFGEIVDKIDVTRKDFSLASHEEQTKMLDDIQTSLLDLNLWLNTW